MNKPQLTAEMEQQFDVEAQARQDERNKVIEEVEETLKGLDCGFCNYEDEVKIRLNQLKEGKC